MLLSDKKLSVIIPCYNESENLPQVVAEVLGVFIGKIPVEIVIVDDCSSDGSYEIARKLADDNASVFAFRHDINQGKGAALKTGFMEAKGDIICIQDSWRLKVI